MFTRTSILVGALIFSNAAFAEDNSAEEKVRKTFSDNFMTLGTPEAKYGGDDFIKFDRDQIKNQIKTFIPPLLKPAVTQHAYVLPPGAVSISTTQRFASMDGEDFFKDGEPNKAVFGDFRVDRQLSDFDLFYGFDLNQKYLHGFTLRVNIPYLASQTDGSVHPNGQQFISLENSGSSQELGDVGIFLKKKIFDQGTHPFGLAVVAAAILPTGKNDEQFGSNGRISASRPQPPNTTAAQGFDAVMQANVANGTWNDPRCFFSNFNAQNFATSCNSNGPFSAPAAAVQSFSPGGANADNAFVGDFPFNNGVFGRFSADGRLPSTLQPGTGERGYLLGVFGTRQFDHGSVTGRAALHLGLTHRFVSESDGIDFGDTTTIFASFIKPVFKDYLAFDLSFIGFDHEDDSYEGKIPEPEIHTCTGGDVGAISGCNAVGDQAFVFELHDRASFSGGFTGYFAPSLIFSPDPQFRASISTLYRFIDPNLGPAPEYIVRAAMEYTF